MHCLERALAQVVDALALFLALIERLVGPQLRLDLLVFRQRLSVLRPELAGGFAFGEGKILETILGHHACSGSSNARAHLLLLELAFFRHGETGGSRAMIPQPENAAKYARIVPFFPPRASRSVPACPPAPCTSTYLASAA